MSTATRAARRLFTSEVDGGPHVETTDDVGRSSYLESQGLKTLRFRNNDVGDFGRFVPGDIARRGLRTEL